MSRDLNELLQQTADEPTRPLDAAAVVGRARRRTLMARTGRGLGVMAAVALASFAALPLIDGSNLGIEVADEPVGRDHPAPTPGGQSPEDLVGKTFASTTVTEAGEPRVLIDEPVRVDFPEHKRNDEQIVGFEAACNDYWGAFEITPLRMVSEEDAEYGYSADEHRFNGTEVGCPDEFALEDQWLNAFFAAGPAWELDGQQLTLTVDDTVIVLQENTALIDEEVPATLLEGRTFTSVEVLEEGARRDLVEGTEIAVTFHAIDPNAGSGRYGDPSGADHHVVWSAGCNSSDSAVHIQEAQLELVGRGFSTLMACAQEKSEQDQWLSRFFQENPRWQVDGDQLILTTNGTVIVFAQAPTTSQTMDPSDESIARVATSEGAAILALDVQPREISPSDQVILSLTNSGDVPLFTGLHFTVERWESDSRWADATWDGFGFDDVGRTLRPGQSTDPQSFPLAGPDRDSLEPGRYRITKSATYQPPDMTDATDEEELVVRNEFLVR